MSAPDFAAGGRCAVARARSSLPAEGPAGGAAAVSARRHSRGLAAVDRGPCAGLDLHRLHRPGPAGGGVGGVRLAHRGRRDAALARAAGAVAGAGRRAVDRQDAGAGGGPPPARRRHGAARRAGRRTRSAGRAVLTAWLLDRGISTWYDDLDWLGGDVARRGRTAPSWSPAGPATGRIGDEPLDVGRRAYALARVDLRHPSGRPAGGDAERRSTTACCRAFSTAGRCRGWRRGWTAPRRRRRRCRALLQRLVDLPGTICRAGRAGAAARRPPHRLQALLPRLRAFMRDADGVEAAWIGKGAGTIVRLAGLLSLMDWAAGGGEEPCTTVEEQHVERAHALWTDYFWPHAQAVFGQASLDDRRAPGAARRPLAAAHAAADRVARGGAPRGARQVRGCRDRGERDRTAGAVRRAADAGAADGPAGGRPRRRWQVNPELWAG